MRKTLAEIFAEEENRPLRRLTKVERRSLGIALHYDAYYRCQPGYEACGTMRVGWMRSLDRLVDLGLLKSQMSHAQDMPYPVYYPTEAANRLFTRCEACECAIRTSHWKQHKLACLKRYGPDPR